jgi:hypothetical protein
MDALAVLEVTKQSLLGCKDDRGNEAQALMVAMGIIESVQVEIEGQHCKSACNSDQVRGVTGVQN